MSHDGFVSVNNVLRKYDDMKEERKNSTASTVHQRLQSIYKTMISYCLKRRKNIESKNKKDKKGKKNI